MVFINFFGWEDALGCAASFTMLEACVKRVMVRSSAPVSLTLLSVVDMSERQPWMVVILPLISACRNAMCLFNSCLIQVE